MYSDSSVSVQLIMGLWHTEPIPTPCLHWNTCRRPPESDKISRKNLPRLPFSRTVHTESKSQPIASHNVKKIRHRGRTRPRADRSHPFGRAQLRLGHECQATQPPLIRLRTMAATKRGPPIEKLFGHSFLNVQPFLHAHANRHPLAPFPVYLPPPPVPKLRFRTLRQSIRPFVRHRLRQSSTARFRPSLRPGLPPGCLERRTRLAHCPLHGHAGPHPPSLLSGELAHPRFPSLAEILESQSGPFLSASPRPSPLATPILGHPNPPRRTLLRKMGVHPRQSRPQRSCRPPRRLAIPRHPPCFFLARPLTRSIPGNMPGNHHFPATIPNHPILLPREGPASSGP